MKKIISLTLLFLALCSTGSAQSTPPVLFFSDLNSGPATGNGDVTFTAGGGVYVTIYGNFLTSGTITLNGLNCLTTISAPSTWLWYQRMIVQLGSGCTTGNFVVTTSNGTSNGLPFTVRSGGIFYIATTGSDSNSGTFASPWLTMHKAAQTVGTTTGNTVYVENGVVNAADDGQGWGGALTLRQAWCAGTQAAPNAIIAYPGATATLGGTAANAISSTDSTASPGACGGGWTFGELTLRGNSIAGIRGPSFFWRIIGNDMSTGAGAGGAAGSFEPLQAQNNKILGNNMHQLNTTSTNRLSQGLYLSTDADHSEVGWNSISFTGGRTALQVHSSPLCIPSCGASDTTGFIMFDIQIHDNIIHDSREECMVIDTEDPHQGAVLVYNNVLYNCGLDGAADGNMYHPMSSDYNTGVSSGINGTGSGGTGSGTVQVYNNTIYYNAGTAGWTSNFEIHTNQAYIYNVRNNILYSSNGTGTYWSPGLSSSAAQGGQCTNGNTPAQCPNFSGSNNLVFGDGAATYTAILGAGVNVNPNFVTPGSDFHLQAGSLALGAGTTSNGPVPTYDIDGKIRPNPPSIGAYEVSSGTGGTPAVSLNPTSISFGNSIITTPTSATQVTLSNTGSASLTITSIVISGTNSGDFSQVNGCGSSVAANANCTISVTFTPIALGARSASLVITDNAPGSPHTVPLSGTGTDNESLSISSFNFLNQYLSTTSSIPLNVTLSNLGAGTITFTSFPMSGDFGQSNTCGASLPGNSTCHILVTFTPTVLGARSGSLTVNDTSGGTPHIVTLSGTGVRIVSGTGSIAGTGTIKVAP